MLTPDVTEPPASPQLTRSLDGGDSVAPHANLQDFKCFRKLPPELRWKIWKYALPRGVDDDGERILTLQIHIVSEDPVEGIAINFSASVVGGFEGRMRHWMACTAAEEDRDRFTADLRNVTLLSTCVESRTVVLNTFKNTLPMIKNGVLRYGDETVICIPNWSFANIREPIQRAMSANRLVPSFPVRHFTTVPLLWALTLGTGIEYTENLSLFEGLKCVKFSGEYLRQVVYRGLGRDKTESMIKGVLSIILESLRRHNKIVPGFSIPKLGIWGSKANGHREMEWVTSPMDEEQFLRMQEDADEAKIRLGFT